MAVAPKMTIEVKIQAGKLECALLEIEAAAERCKHSLELATRVACIRRQLRREIRDKFRRLHEELAAAVEIDEISPTSHNHGIKS